MSQIAVAADVSKGTLYNYFSSKAELFAAYIDRDCSRLSTKCLDINHSLSPPENMLYIGRQICRMLLSEPALVMYRMAVAEAEKFPELARTFYAVGPAREIAYISAYLNVMALNGGLRVENSDLAAEQFLALIETQLCMKRRLRLIEMPSEAEIDHVIACAVHLFMCSYGWEAEPP